MPGLFETSHLLLVVNCSLNFPIYYMAGGGARRHSVQELSKGPRQALDTRGDTGPCQGQDSSLEISFVSLTGERDGQREQDLQIFCSQKDA